MRDIYLRVHLRVPEPGEPLEWDPDVLPDPDEDDISPEGFDFSPEHMRSQAEEALETGPDMEWMFTKIVSVTLEES